MHARRRRAYTRNGQVSHPVKSQPRRTTASAMERALGMSGLVSRAFLVDDVLRERIDVDIRGGGLRGRGSGDLELAGQDLGDDVAFRPGHDGRGAAGSAVRDRFDERIARLSSLLLLPR